MVAILFPCDPYLPSATILSNSIFTLAVGRCFVVSGPIFSLHYTHCREMKALQESEDSHHVRQRLH